MKKWLFWITLLIMAVALISKHWLGLSIVAFVCSALALIIISKILGDATEQASHYVGQSIAGLLNVTFSNMAELIIIFSAIQAGLFDLVKAGIVGSVAGNLLLVMGCSIYFGCKKNGTLTFDPSVATIYITQLFLVVSILILPTVFANRVGQENLLTVSNLFALLLVAYYIYSYRLRLTDKRFKPIREQAEKIDHRWSKGKAVGVMVVSTVAAFFMSELLISEVETVAVTFSISTGFIGFIILPLLGNIAEHMVAVYAARDPEMTELSLSIAVGSASQVGMVIAPLAVVFGMITGNTFLLDFTGLPIEILIISSIAGFVVLRDSQWNINEGVMLIFLYLALGVMFYFSL